MRRLFVATGAGLGVVEPDGSAEVRLEGMKAQCLAVREGVAYCGTFGQGLWKSVDGGITWAQVGEGIPYGEVMAVAVSDGVVWAGTEPSALFRSEDGGRTWQERPSLRTIPSAPTWSFPPRPWTHHVRWIAPDPNAAERLYVAIELGGVMKSEDGGMTWEDRKPGAKLDAHTLSTHRLAPGRLFEAAGDGYAETRDGGASWQAADGGLPWRYLWGLAADPADPATLMVSASPGPRHAHDARWVDEGIGGWHRGMSGEGGAEARRPLPFQAGPPPWAGYEWRGPEASLQRRVGDGPWAPVTDGLPAARGTLAYVLATHDAEPHVFYASPASNAIYRSADAGRSWEAVPVAWPEGFADRRVNALAVAELG